jgi:hypothetical protein
MVEQETLEACYEAGRTGAFSISEDAHARARALGYSPADVRHALGQAVRCARASGPDGRWTVDGPSLDGSVLTLSIVLVGGTLSVV